jgi:uncharacterized protein
MEPERLAMFPLGSPLVPGMGLPLRVFEPRYRIMTQEVLAGSGEFGVVLIERGFEVGGGDVRFDVGTIARIVQAAESPDGRYALQAVGTHRIQVHEWLPDDPYPVAMVERLVDPDPGPDAATVREDVDRILRRVTGLRSELGHRVEAVELHADPAVASWHAALAGGLGPLDVQRLLGLNGPDERLAAVADALTDLAELLEMELRAG